MNNPFSFGSPVSAQDLLGRRAELRRIAGRILRQGQSSAIVGEPRTGKTSLLCYLMSPAMGQTLYGDACDRLLFRYLDAQTLGGSFSPEQFWAYALEPLAVIRRKPQTLTDALQICATEGYGNFVLERLLIRLQDTGYKLVLLLDEFDALVEHIGFQQAEFYGGLRSLASRCESLALVIASRQALNNLDQRTEKFSRNGSPFSNFMQEIFLGPLADKECDELASLAGSRFGAKDRKFLRSVAGNHPYLLQVAASALWETYEEDTLDFSERWQRTGEILFDQVEGTLSDTWRLWSAEMKKAFTILALDELPLLLGKKQFDTTALIRELDDYKPELRDLKRRGFISEDPEMESGWHIPATVMLWWLADVWIKSLRQQDNLGLWLNNQGWDGGLLKASERKQIGTAVKNIAAFFKGGAETFIKASAEGLGRGMTGIK